MSDIGAIILAGGKSSRMGTDKALLKIDGKTMIEHIIAKVEKITKNILISTNIIDYHRFKYPIVEDKFKSCGPLCGIYSALSYSNFKYNIVIACDTPFLPINLFKLLSTKKDNIWVMHRGKIEPLIGLYSKNLLLTIEDAIYRKDYKIRKVLGKFFNIIDVSYINEKYFLNLNTPDDYHKALKNNLLSDFFDC